MKIIGEQAEWGYGKEYFAKGDLDAVFAFPLYMAVGRFNKQDLMNKIDSTFLSTPAGKHQLVFIENHDTDRFASVVAENPGKLRVGAALNILLKGIPSIYYGQELGMKGVKQEWGPTDANDILRREATADAERQGGSAPLEVPYLRASPWRLWRKRIVWLLVLFAAEAYTSTVLRAFEQEMETVIALAFFIPLLIGTGGNTGTQITTTLVRALATEQVRLRDLPRIVGKEMSTGFLVAATMAAAALIRAWMLGVGVEVTITVCLTVTAIVLWSSLVASILPPTIKRLRLDPAVVSAPMISTIVDGTGLMIYFAIAHLTIPQLAGL